MRRIALKLPLSRLARSVLNWYAGRWFRGAAGPISVGCYVTNRCNLRCAMCNYWRGGKPQDIPIDLFRRLVDDLSLMRCYYFSITGGEPFLLGDIIERLTYAGERLPYVHAVTNGWLIDESLARAIGKSGIREISVSVDGFRGFNDELRGRPGAFDHAMNAINLLRTHAPEVYIVTNTVIAAENLSEILPLIDEFGKMGVYSKLQPVNRHPDLPVASSSSRYEGFAIPDDAELRGVLRALALRKHVINSMYFLSKIPGHFGGRPLMERGFKCLVPKFHLELLWDSRAYPCLTGMDWEGGFPCEDGLKGLVESTPYRALQKRLEACRKCDYNLQICYWEPRIIFPFGCWVRYRVLGIGKGRL